MPTKKELMSLIDGMSKTEFTKGEVKSFINSVNTTDSMPPTEYRKGDVIANGVGAKKRPMVVISIVGNMMYGIPLSSTQDEFNLSESKSRFMGDGWFSKGVSVVTKEYADENFIGVYDNMKLLNKAIELMKNEISKL